MGLAPEPAALLRGMVLGGDAGIPERHDRGLSRRRAQSHPRRQRAERAAVRDSRAGDLPRRSVLAQASRLARSGGVDLHLRAALRGAGIGRTRRGDGAGGLGRDARVAPVVTGLRTAARRRSSCSAWNPRATADVGAQLSFAAVLGIMAFTRPTAPRGCDRWPRLGGRGARGDRRRDAGDRAADGVSLWQRSRLSRWRPTCSASR